MEDTKLYNTKLVIAGNSTELYKYSKVITSGSRVTNDKGRGNTGGNRDRKNTLHKAKTKILRIVNSNTWTMMWTLTYADDVTIEESKKDVCKFIKQIRKIYSTEFKYLYVLELTKRGRPHYHMLVDIVADYTDLHSYERYLADIWSHGFIDVQMITNSKGAGHYISKYFTKDPVDTSCKLYGYSRNCNKPTEVKILDTREPIEILKELDKTVVYSSSYQIDYNKNHVNYYVLEDTENIEDSKYYVNVSCET